MSTSSTPIPGDGTDGESDHGPPAADFELAFGDVPLLVPTVDVEAFVYQYLPLRRYFEQAYPPAGGWMASPNAQWPQTPELNTVYWPTGVTRWGFGVFLFSGKYLDKVESAIRSDGSGLLKMGDPDDDDHYIEVRMRPLCPVPITGNSETSNDDDGYPLYLLPLVCKRYNADVSTTVGSTDFIPGVCANGVAGRDEDDNLIVDQYGDLSIYLETNGAYGFGSFRGHSGALNSDSGVFPKYYHGIESSCLTSVVPYSAHSYAQFKEIVAWGVGLTFVVEANGDYQWLHRSRPIGSATNEERFEEFKSKVDDGTFEIVAGFINQADDQANLNRLLSAGVPSTFTLSGAGATDIYEPDNFVYEGRQPHEGDSNTPGFAILSGDILGFQGKAASWRVASPLVWSDDEDDEIANPGMVKDITGNIGEEWFMQVGNPVDLTLAGICNIPLSSHTDTVEWHHGSRGPQTRVKSRLWNAFPTRLINQINIIADDRGGPRRWEVVLVNDNEDGVTFNGKEYSALYPIQQEGFAEFDVNTAVNAGWDPFKRHFVVADQRPLDFELISQKVADWLEEHNYFDDGILGSDIDGGSL